MWNTLMVLQQKLTWSIPLFMLAGLAYGYLFEASDLRFLILPLTFVMVYPMMVTLNLQKLFTRGNTKLQGAALLINFVLMPFIGYTMGRIFFADRPMIILGLLLTSLLPTSGMTISWTGMAKGDVSSAVKMTVIGLITGSLLTPLYLKVLMGAIIDIPMLEVFRQIITVVFLPMFFGYLTQWYLINRYGQEEFQNNYKKKFPALSTLGVLAIVFVAMSLRAKTILSNPADLLYLLLPLLLLYVVNFTLSTVIGKAFFNRGEAIALVYGTVMRNLSIALAIAMAVFGQQGAEIALVIALAYIIQVQSAAWYVKLNNQIFGSAEKV